MPVLAEKICFSDALLRAATRSTPALYAGLIEVTAICCNLRWMQVRSLPAAMPHFLVTQHHSRVSLIARYLHYSVQFQML